MISMTVESTIERRLLVNYRIAPEVVAKLLPSPLRPQLVRGHAVGGICFIRLGDLRPAGVPKAFGLRTENVAHRFAVEWDDSTGNHVGVYVPRRDSDSRITAASGGRIFPGRHHLARFAVSERDGVRITVAARDNRLRLSVEAHETGGIGGELFSSTEEALDFFRCGSLGLAPQGSAYAGVRLECARWEGVPMQVERIRSNLFDDVSQFPKGSIEFDGALLMKDLPVRWVPTQHDLQFVSTAAATTFAFPHAA
jgi:hypothetical protein